MKSESMKFLIVVLSLREPTTHKYVSKLFGGSTSPSFNVDAFENVDSVLACQDLPHSRAFLCAGVCIV